LVVLTILGAAGMNSSSLELKMSGNSLGKTTSFQGAEDVRVLAENTVNTLVQRIEVNGDTPAQAAANAGLNKGFYDLTTAAAPAVDTIAFWGNTNNYKPVGTTGGYVVEYFGVQAVFANRLTAPVSGDETLVHVFRLTAVGDASDGARTALQAMYMRR
jgi:Tfp pilus assembly protein PilX